MTIDDVRHEGIAGIEQVDIEVARSLDHEIKPVGLAELVGDDEAVPAARARVIPGSTARAPGDARRPQP
jgi:homoserine dehydrogenase